MYVNINVNMLRVYTCVDARNAQKKKKKQLVVLERRSNSRQNNTRRDSNIIQAPQA